MQLSSQNYVKSMIKNFQGIFISKSYIVSLSDLDFQLSNHKGYCF